MGCVSQDSEPSKKSIPRKSVTFSEGTCHHIKFRERKGPSQGVIQKCEPQERNPCAPRLEDRTRQETLHQARCARREAWDLAKSVCKFEAQDKATFYSPTDAWVMRAPSSKKPEEREFMVDSGASMHMLSKKGLKLR